MKHCAEERRKLAAEWSHFHAQEKQRHERVEREVNSLLERREGSIISLAQVSYRVEKCMLRLLLTILVCGNNSLHYNRFLHYIIH